MKLLPTFATATAIAVIGAAGCVRTPPTTTGTAAPKPIATTPAEKPTLLQKAKISKACSEQADARNLNGKQRKAFRAECIRSGGRSF